MSEKPKVRVRHKATTETRQQRFHISIRKSTPERKRSLNRYRPPHLQVEPLDLSALKMAFDLSMDDMHEPFCGYRIGDQVQDGMWDSI